MALVLDPAPRVALGEARVVQEAALLEPGDRLLDLVLVEAVT